MIRYRCGFAALFITVLASGTPGLAQSPFMNLTPGVSVKADVARALGNPLRPSRRGGFEYPPPDGLAAVEVYFDGKDTVQRIDVILEQPVTRRAVAERFGLPALESARAATGGKRVDFFADAALSLTYVSDNVADGVGAIGHYSATAFEAASGLRATPSSSTPPGGNGAAITRRPLTPWTFTAGVRFEGTRLAPSYGVANAEQCQADCADRATCRALTTTEARASNPRAPTMCDLWSSVTRVLTDPAFSSWVKR